MSARHWIRHNMASFGAKDPDAPKDKDVPKRYKNEHRLHWARMNPDAPGQETSEKREQVAQQDAMQLAIKARQQGKHDVGQVMEGVEYWEYVFDYDNTYYDAVKNLANRFISEGTVDQVMEQVPFVPPQQQGGGAGGMGFASRARQTKKAMYLLRRDGRRYRLRGTLGDSILRGKLAYPDQEGNFRRMRAISKDNIVVPRGSMSAKAVKSLEMIKKLIVREIAHILRGKVDDPQGAAAATMDRARRRCKMDALPVTVALNGPARALAAMRRVEGAEIPPETTDAIRAMGRLMAPYIEDLKLGLKKDDIRFVDMEADLKPTYDVAPAVKRSPSVLKEEDIDVSSDVKSLVMTLATSDDLAPLAARRLKRLICRHPDLLEREGFSEADLGALEKTESGNGVVMMERLRRADDADFLEAYYDYDQRDEETARLLVDLAAAQRRSSVIGAIPGLCARGLSGSEPWVSLPYFCHLNPADTNARHVIIDVCRAREGGMLSLPGDILDRKVMGAWLNGTSADEMEEFLESCKKSRILTCFAICWLAENAGDRLSEKALGALPRGDSDENAMACLATLGLGQAFMRAARRLGVTPRGMATIAGKKAIIPYLKNNRIDWDDKPVPRASEIFSAPEDAVPLARNLASIEDKDGLMVLLRKCAEGTRGRNGKKQKQLAQFVWDALKELGAEEEAAVLLKSMGLIFSKGQIRGVPSVPSKPSGERVRDALEMGDEVGAAIMLDRIASEDEDKARDILSSLPAPEDPGRFVALLLPGILEGDGVPLWVHSIVASAELLPGGIVISGRPSCYRIEGEKAPCFACAAPERAAWATVLAGRRPAPHEAE